MSGQQSTVLSVRLTVFSMRDATVGGYAPARVALRRAIALGMDCEREIRLVHGGQGTVAHTVLATYQWGFDASLRSEMGQHDPRGRGRCSASTAISTATATATATADASRPTVHRWCWK